MIEFYVILHKVVEKSAFIEEKILLVQIVVLVSAWLFVCT